MMDENFTEIDRIEIFSKDGYLVQRYTNSDSDSNVKLNQLYKVKIPNNYLGKSAEKVWSLLTPYQRSHYLDDHENGNYQELIHKDWDELNDRVRNGFEMHVAQGQYAEGGHISEGNYNMAKNQAKELCHHATELHSVLKKEKHIEAWVISKLERATSDLSDVTHYLDGLSEQHKD